MRILILGAGAIGGYFGGRLLEAGRDVTFLVREPRQRRLREHGLRIRSPHGDLQLPVATVTNEQVGGAYDVVLLAPKAYDLDTAIEAIRPAVGTATAVIPFLNGLAHLDRLDTEFGAERVLGGVAHLVAQLAADGVIEQLAPLQSLTIGGRSPATQAIAASFEALCHDAEFDSLLADHIVTALWEKWVFLATLAAATTLMQADVGSIVATRDGTRLIRALYDECLAVATAGGIAIPSPKQAQALALLTQPGSSFTASMLRDMRRGQRTEHDQILGDLVVRADGYDLAVPILRTAYCRMQAWAATAP